MIILLIIISIIGFVVSCMFDYDGIEFFSGLCLLVSFVIFIFLGISVSTGMRNSNQKVRLH